MCTSERQFIRHTWGTDRRKFNTCGRKKIRSVSLFHGKSKEIDHQVIISIVCRLKKKKNINCRTHTAESHNGRGSLESLIVDKLPAQFTRDQMSMRLHNLYKILLKLTTHVGSGKNKIVL